MGWHQTFHRSLELHTNINTDRFRNVKNHAEQPTLFSHLRESWAHNSRGNVAEIQIIYYEFVYQGLLKPICFALSNDKCWYQPLSKPKNAQL